MTVKIDAPSLHIMLGNGHIALGRDSLNHIDFTDISGEGHTSGRKIRNYIPYNEFFTISIIFSFEYMQIKINDEIRYFSKKEKYMTSKLFPALNNEGLEIKINCDKRSELVIKDFTITEFDNDVPEIIAGAEDLLPYTPAEEHVEKHSFDFCISGLSKELQDEIRQTNEYIMSLKPLKLKRKIDGRGVFCNIVYISEYGFSYNIHTQRNMAAHTMGWILYNTHREQQKYGGKRKRELTDKTLAKLAETSPEFAERMYNNLEECLGCACRGVPKTCNLDGCIICKKSFGLCPTLITYNGKKMSACHGRMAFKMTPSDFADAREVIDTINDIVAEEKL